MNRLLVLALVLAFARAAQTGDNTTAGKTKAAQVCATCHDAENNKPIAPENPILAGQHQDYLLKAMKDYKSGKRNNPIMKGFAAGLSNQDMQDLAAWFASQPSNLHFQR